MPRSYDLFAYLQPAALGSDGQRLVSPRSAGCLYIARHVDATKSVEIVLLKSHRTGGAWSWFGKPLICFCTAVCQRKAKADDITAIRWRRSDGKGLGECRCR
jgi:hypothetical protein